VELQALVPAADVELTRDVDTIALELPGVRSRWSSSHTTCTTRACSNPETRALTVQFEVDNRGNQL
jgi:hypothetical protein